MTARTMKALEIIDYEGKEGSFRVVEKDIPALKEGEVLVKVHISPINPSDLAFVKGQYGIKKRLPVVAGFEGGGVIEDVSPNAKLKKGQRVSCVAKANGDGIWAEYLVTTEENCIPLLDSVSLDEGSTFFVNPLTAYSMVSMGEKHQAKAFVQTAAASALGKMIIRLCRHRSIPLVNIVRRKEQVEILKKEGAEYVLDSTDEKFDKELFKLSKKLDTTFLLDAVSGDLVTKVFSIMPAKTKLLSYGALSEQPITINPGVLIFQEKTFAGYWLNHWINSMTRDEFINHTIEAQKLVPLCFRSEIHKRFPIESGYAALEYYKLNMSAGKTVFAGASSGSLQA